MPTPTPTEKGWVMRNPPLAVPSLTVVAWTSDDEAWAAGRGGSLVRSLDGGETWTSVEVPRVADWIAVGRAGDGALWLAGLDGTRLHSADDGATWHVAVESPIEPYNAETLAWLATHTEPGRVLVDQWGRSWIVTGRLERIDGASLQLVGEPPGRPSAFGWASETTAWSGGGWMDIVHLPVTTPGIEGIAAKHTGFLRPSDDSGATWPSREEPRPVEGAPPVPPDGRRGLTLHEAMVRFVVFDARGAGMVLGGDPLCPETNHPLAATIDGGARWSFGGAWPDAAGEAPDGPADLCVPDEREKRLRCTWDSGKSWYGGSFPGAVPGSETNPDGRCVAARDPHRILAVDYYGRIFRAEDERWVTHNGGPTPHLSNVAMSAGFVVAVGEGSVLVSRDRGLTWSEAPVSPLDVPEGLDTFAEWAAVAVVDASHAWIGSKTGVVRATEDAGATWTDRSTGLPTDFVGGEDFDARQPGVALLHFFDASRGLAAVRKRLFATEDGGRTWRAGELPGPVEESPTLLATLPGSSTPVTFLSDRRHVWRSDDVGATFRSIADAVPNPPTYSTITQLVSGGSGLLFLVDGTRVLRSEDGGATWPAYGYLADDFPIGASVRPDGTFVAFWADGSGRRVVFAENAVEPVVELAPRPFLSGARVLFDDTGRGILVGAAGRIATLEP